MRNQAIKTAAATDDQAELSDFFRDFHSLVARGLNAYYGRGENLWAPGSFGNVEVHGNPSLEDQLLYLWTNPVKDGLVARPEDWPGVKFLPEDFGVRLIADIGWRRLAWFYPSARVSYQARDIDHAGVSGGFALNFDW